MIFILAFLALFEPGDRVAVACPGYPPYRHILAALGCEPVLIETTEETRWAITVEALLAAHESAGSFLYGPPGELEETVDSDAGDATDEPRTGEEPG